MLQNQFLLSIFLLLLDYTQYQTLPPRKCIFERWNRKYVNHNERPFLQGKPGLYKFVDSDE